MRSFSLRAGALLLALLAMAQAAVADSVKSVDEAVAASKKTGKPILAVLGSKT